MASTYSPLLRYELIGSGEQAGVWGNTTNVNLGSLVEQSIAGVTNIVATSLGGTTYPLTALNGAPDEARSMVLNFTGSAGSAFTVTVPTSQKLYVVRNNTGQTITFQTTSPGSTTTSVATANSTMIFCDGTNVLPGIAAPGVGTLLVSGGGTGATTFSAGFIKSPSPGGTTALTSVASIDLTADVGTSILPVANGGTGIASPATGRLLLGNGTSAMTTLAGTGTGNFVAWNGTSWAEATLLGTTKGGTGLSSYTTGQILYSSATNTLAPLNIGAVGQVLTVSASGVPAWTAPTASGVASFSAGSTGLTPATATTGAVSLAGTLNTANGGTGLTTFTAGNRAIYSTSASALTAGTLPIAAGGTGETTLAATQSAFKIPYGPIFSVYRIGSQTQTLISGTNYFTKVGLNTDDFGAAAANGFNLSTNRFLPNVAGYYELTGTVRAFSGTGASGNIIYGTEIRKNGLSTAGNVYRGNEASAYLASSSNITVQATVTATVYLNGTSDYVELFFGMSTNGTNPTLLDEYGSFSLTSRLQGNFVRYP